MKFKNPFKKKNLQQLASQVHALTSETRRTAQKDDNSSPEKATKPKTKEPSFKEQMRENREIKRQKKRHKLSTQEQRRNLEDYLNKAGYPDTNVEKLKQRIFRIALNVMVVAWVLPLVLAVMNGVGLWDFLSWAFWWTAGSVAALLLLWIILWGIVYFYLEMRIYYRTKELEEVLPDFLQLTSSNISAGMPIDRALWLAIRPNFGVLAKEIEDVAKATLSGEDLSTSLKNFSNRYESNLLKRSVSILLEGLEAGGEMADLLNKIALNIQEIKIMKKEMAANVTTYAIFISFSSIVVAPVLFALASQLVRIIISITSGIDVSGSSSAISLTTSVDPQLAENFKMYSYFMLSVTAGMSAAIISVIRNGNVRDGLRNIPLYIIIALIIFFLANGFFANIFDGFF